MEPPPHHPRPPMQDIQADNDDDDAEGILAHLGILGGAIVAIGFLILGAIELGRQLLFCRKNPENS